ncbi:hypothetical protein T440DRAFT_4439 [Plenodomus tracheiphilus IPT5]|uniref:Uncharacterized protein n=1 Tax=Plenodomus tracheiphilus IPT5 TaxID=1408161 RepID=A0A6A7BMD2_9PLEO|nr:hypothetical protein T440DRAFT_4439 [Plenodomus tracheiphilus IPT5]
MTIVQRTVSARPKQFPYELHVQATPRLSSWEVNNVFQQSYHNLRVSVHGDPAVWISVHQKEWARVHASSLRVSKAVVGLYQVQSFHTTRLPQYPSDHNMQNRPTGRGDSRTNFTQTTCQLTLTFRMQPIVATVSASLEQVYLRSMARQRQLPGPNDTLLVFNRSVPVDQADPIMHVCVCSGHVQTHSQICYNSSCKE